MYTLLLFALALVCVEGRFPPSGWPFADDGIVNPDSKYQRYRRDEYEDPFYQWWYFWLKDTETGDNWAITYMTTSSSFNTTGAYVLFAQVDSQSREAKMRTVKFPVAELKITNDFDYSVDNFHLTAIDKDTYRLQGKMDASQKNWIIRGWNESVPIEWDVTYHRVYGWFGQPDFETLDEHYHGVIMWNTYSHNAEIEGTIKIGDKKYTLTRTQSFRGYGDMNWGQQFPSPPKSDPKNMDYSWGWYSACLTAPNPLEDVCIIAGAGLTATGFPLYSMKAEFADIRITNKTHVGVRVVSVWDESILPIQWSSTNDVKVISFKVTRANWTSVTDAFGTAKIPMTQNVEIVTQNYHVTMDFQSQIWEYNRLLFPFKDNVFSDFEALSVKCDVKIWHQGQLIHKWTTLSAGLEYGYNAPVTLPTQ